MTSDDPTRTIARLVNQLGPSIAPAKSAPPQAAPATALVWGCLLTLCVTGYTFGQSNHHVYLLDALRFTHPELLTRDWFTTHTLQYHYLFTLLTVGLQKIGLLQAGFFSLYLGLVVAMHAAWLSIVRSIGGDVRSYLLSVLFYHLSGGGLGLGVYQILQDGSFLPSNIAAVATLGAMAYWLRGRIWPTALCVAVAGLFHVNYALACVAAWVGLSLLAMLRERRVRPFLTPSILAATVVALGPCLYTIAVTALAARQQDATIPMSDFFAVYVHLRHSHHHEPLAWPLALWVSFLWPVPFALYALWILPKTRAVQGVIVVLLTVLALQLFAVLFAGVWYVSETLVQLSLFRFSPFAKLLTCVLAAWLIGQHWRSIARWVPAACIVVGLGLIATLVFRSHWPANVPAPTPGLLFGAGALSLWLAIERLTKATDRDVRVSLAAMLVVAVPAILGMAALQRLGVAMPGEDDPEMAATCAWVRQHTPTDALFLVPPHDMSFILGAQRAEIVSFKHVPQLAKELIEWKKRLDDVLDMDVATLPTPMPRTMDAMARRYAALSPDELRAVAAKYGCDYLITMAPLPGEQPLFVSPDGRYRVYKMQAP